MAIQNHRRVRAISIRVSRITKKASITIHSWLAHGACVCAATRGAEHRNPAFDLDLTYEL